MVALVVAIGALGVVWFRSDGGQTIQPTPTRDVASFLEGNELHVGYGGFPPYTVVNVDDLQKPTGFSVALVEEMARRATPPIQVVWHQFNWETLKADLEAGTFDFIADPVYVTIERSKVLDFSIPYSFFGIGAAVVRADDDRFREFDDLNRSDITISVAEGWTTTEYARRRLDKPKFEPVSVTGSATTQLDDVRFGRADVALNDVVTVAGYVAEHKDVKALWLESPPSRVAGAFAVRAGEFDLVQFLNEGLTVLIADGTLQLEDAKWKTVAELPVPCTVPGRGIEDAAGR